MIQNETSFLKELQMNCLNNSNEYLKSYTEALSIFSKNSIEGLKKLRTVIQSMKKDFTSVCFLQFSDLLNMYDEIIENCLTIIETQEAVSSEKSSDKFPESEKQVLDFLLSAALDEIKKYIDTLKQTYIDSEEIKEKRKDPIRKLAAWVDIYTSTTQSTPTPPAPTLAPAIQTTTEEPIEEKEIEKKSGLFLLFQNGKQFFAIAIEHIVEVVKTQHLSPPPYKRSNLSGLLNLRGDILPILNIQELVTDSTSNLKYVVVTQFQDLKFGFQVEFVHQVVSLDPSTFQTVHGLSANSRDNMISHFCQTENKTISILKLKDVVAA